MYTIHSSSFKSKELFVAQASLERNKSSHTHKISEVKMSIQLKFQRQTSCLQPNFRNMLVELKPRRQKVYTAQVFRGKNYTEVDSFVHSSNSRKNVTLLKLLQRATTVYSQLNFGGKKTYTAQDTEGKVYTGPVLEGKRCIQLKLLQMAKKNAFSSNFRSKRSIQLKCLFRISYIHNSNPSRRNNVCTAPV